MDQIYERTPIYGYDEVGPVGFGENRVSYLLHFKRTFPKGFLLEMKEFWELSEFTITLETDTQKTEYYVCTWQKQGETGDEWQQNESLTAISYERVMENA